MTHLKPIVTEIGLLNKQEVTTHFLDGNELYFTTVERKGEVITELRWKVNIQRPKSRISVKESEWPKVPVKAKTKYTIQHRLYACWVSTIQWQLDKVLECGYGKRVHSSQVTKEHFNSIVSKPEFHAQWFIDEEWIQRCTEEARQNIIRQQGYIDERFVPMREATEPQSDVIARIFGFDGDQKSLVQGLQRLGVNAKGFEKRNFVTKGFAEIPNLEELIFSEQPE